MNMIDLVLATDNIHKVNEIRKIAGLGFSFRTLKDIGFTAELPETSGTIPGNALQKARTVWDALKMNCLADDSGLCVTALHGEPGVDSAFYAGLPRNNEANISLLLKNMEGIDDRSAEFVTVMALIIDGNEYIFEGSIKGKISKSRDGNSGFGYDPVFTPDGFSKTFAEMSEEEKNEISHRKRALQKVLTFLSDDTER